MMSVSGHSWLAGSHFLPLISFHSSFAPEFQIVCCECLLPPASQPSLVHPSTHHQYEYQQQVASRGGLEKIKTPMIIISSSSSSSSMI